MKKVLKPIIFQAHEVEIHYKRPLLNTMSQIKNSEQVYTFIMSVIDTRLIDVKEFFWAVFLTRNNHILAVSEIGAGSLYQVHVNVREIFQLSLRLHSSALILIHNHPSGGREISRQDKELTAKMKEACSLMDIQLLDHIIISSEDYVSFEDEGEL